MHTIIFTFSWLTLALFGMIPKSQTLEQAQSQNSKLTQKKKKKKSSKILAEAHFKASHRKEQQRVKMRFHPKPIWSDQTEKCSGQKGHTHPQMLWLLVEPSTSRHELLLTASWWLHLWYRNYTVWLLCFSGTSHFVFIPINMSGYLLCLTI